MEEDLQLPFTTRQMLKFQHGTSFGLSITTTQDINETIIITGATRSGPFIFEMAITAAAQNNTQTFALPDIPIWVTVGDASSTIHQNRIYAQCFLTINSDRMHLLAAGYISGFGSITWPAIFKELSRDGIGGISEFSSTNPAAGAQVNVGFDTRAVFKVDMITVNLVTDANAADRNVHIHIAFGSGLETDIPSPTVQAASLTRFYRGMVFGSNVVAPTDNDFIFPLPQDLYLDEGSIISTVTENFQAGDNFGAMAIRGRQWIPV